MTLRFRTAGESHGEGITVMIEGLPFGYSYNSSQVDSLLARRQQGYGRSKRQKIEKDRAKILGGFKKGVSTGGPCVLWVGNRDYKINRLTVPTIPRPGHADLAGCMQWETDDIRAVIERSSARETAGRVAAGGVAAGLLGEFGIKVFSFVREIGGVPALPFKGNLEKARGIRDRSPFFSLDPKADKVFRKTVDQASADGDSLGGIFEVWVEGVPPGIGGYSTHDRRLSARLAQALFAIQAIKGVEIGIGFEAARRPGSQVQDPIQLKAGKWGPISRKTNNLGGLEGGISTGERIVLRAAMKPIPTLRKGIPSIDLKKMKAVQARYERSDVMAVPAASVVGESMVAFELAAAFLEKFGGDSMVALRRAHASYIKALRGLFPRKK